MKKLFITFIVSLFYITSYSNAQKILIVRHELPEFKKVAEKTVTELGKPFQTDTLIITEKTAYEAFAKEVRHKQPKLLLLLDNKAIDFAKRFNKEKDTYAQNLKSVAAMALNIRQSLKNNKNICGIEYEVPAFSLFTQYRNLVQGNLKKVLVFYRKSQHQSMIEKSKKQLELEGINLIAINVEKGDMDATIKNFKYIFLRESTKRNTDAIWVLPDSVLLNNSTLKTWIKSSSKNKTPFISSIDLLVTKMDFCAYAAAPNLNTLSIQLADMCLAILEDNETPTELGIEYIRSIRKVANIKKLKKTHIKVDPEQLKHCEISRN